MQTEKRELVLRQLKVSRDRVLALTQGLSKEQREYRPAADCWSIADCVEHITVVEGNVLRKMNLVIAQPPEPEKAAETQGKEELILSFVPSRESPVKGPEAVMPKGRWPEYADLMRQFESAREQTIGFAAGTQADLHSHFFPHPLLGQFDCYHWLLFLGTHCERHARQMEEIQASTGYPKSVGATA